MRSCKTELLEDNIRLAVILQKLSGGKLTGRRQQKDRWTVI
jgi:hypothetical protein